MSSKFKKGDRVILTGKGLTPYLDWPVWGSDYSCIGAITSIRHGLTHVLWDNMQSRLIDPKNLSHFISLEENSLSPNIAFMLYKRKRNESRR